ncbi:MAG: ATP-binding cassette domain-containing protein [Erysipelotrichales bacterium]|nr:ATP-binding cassette domain-containing protein [Erysipelotrichales bacterium]
MLQIKDIQRYYDIGGVKYWALKGVNVSFRTSEFVAILGASGSGKTTLLNIIGGLDRYSNGDLIIDNVSTKQYKDKDWDAYRNHRIGFVFQSYNLISHLDVLSNVELALTLSGVSAKERKQKALEVLTTVGLKDHVNKKPNQLSGGQQQRVAIARALINDPNIILADEPTGALDTETSVEIMELLTRISKNKLIIMVTHNPELANKYAKRIISLSDGLVVSDTQPYEIKEAVVEDKKDKTAMSFPTALKLSLKNILTKKRRTLITAFAGCIGILGIGLVLAIQSGFGNVLTDMQQNMMASAPFDISENFTQFGFNGNGSDVNLNDNEIKGSAPAGPIMGSNIIDQTFLDFLSSRNTLNYASVHQMTGLNIRAFNIINGVLLDTPRTPQPFNPMAPGNPLVLESFIPDQMISDHSAQWMTIVGSYTGSAAFGATLVLNHDNTINQHVLPFLGLPTDQIININDVLGKTFKILSNNALFEFNGSTYQVRPEADIINLINNNSSDVITVTITNIIRPANEFVGLGQGGIFVGGVANQAIMNLNNNSDVVNAQRSSASSVVDFDSFLLPSFTDTQLLRALGGNNLPQTVLIFPNDFAARDQVVEIINEYNVAQTDPARVITMIDGTSEVFEMLNLLVDTISLVLILFAAVSLVVSSIMIGIITYTSVLERTKEIGVLRSIGARKKDISRVFNAETILIGLFAGILGVLIILGLSPLINHISAPLTPTGAGVSNVTIFHIILLVSISILLTLVAGLIPARIAAKKDPVKALRTE